MTATQHRPASVQAPAGAGRARWWAIPRGQPRQRLYPRLVPLLLALVVSWVLVIFAHVTGNGHQFTHHHLQHSSLAVLLTVILAWQLMTLAMMGPSFLPAARYVAMTTLRPARTVTAFLIGYLLLWSVFLAAVAVGDAILHSVTDHYSVTDHHSAVTDHHSVTGHDGWLAQHDTLLLATILLVAAAWQLTPLKRACLLSCRTGRVLPAKGHRADLGAATFGARHGLACVGSCGPMMLVMLAVDGWHLLWMVVLGTLIWLEKTRWIGRRLAYPTAAGFAVLAVLVFLLN